MTDGVSAQQSGQIRYFLNVGCGRAGRERMPPTLRDPSWNEIRIDVDPGVDPDIVGSFSDLHMIKDDSVDAIWSSHNLEHLPLFEAKQALKEALRVLKPTGFMFVTVPDIEAIARMITEGRLMDTIYQSSMGPITPLDMMYGHQSSQESGNTYMAHRTAFSSRSLARTLHEYGFSKVRVIHGANYDIWALVSFHDLPEDLVQELHAKRGQ